MKRDDVHLKPAQFIVDHSRFRVSLTCCRSSARIGVMVFMFQVPSLSAGTLCFPFVLFGAMITICLSGVVHKPQAPSEADKLWQDSTYLAGGCPA